MENSVHHKIPFWKTLKKMMLGCMMKFLSLMNLKIEKRKKNPLVRLKWKVFSEALHSFNSSIRPHLQCHNICIGITLTDYSPAPIHVTHIRAIVWIENTGNDGQELHEADDYVHLTTSHSQLPLLSCLWEGKKINFHLAREGESGLRHSLHSRCCHGSFSAWSFRFYVRFIAEMTQSVTPGR